MSTEPMNTEPMNTESMTPSVEGPEPSTAQPADEATLASIWHSGWQDGHLGFVPDDVVDERTEVDFRRRTAERLDEMQVVRNGPDVVGFFIVVHDELEQIYVDRSQRGSGVARVLLAAAERQIAAAGHERAWLAVVAGNARARSFYAREGWSDAGPIPYLAEGRDGPIEVPSHRYEKDLSADK